MPDRRNISIEEIAKMVLQVLDKEFGPAKTSQAPLPEQTKPRNRQVSKAFLVTRDMVEDCGRLGKDLQLPYHHILTPSAKDAIDQLGVKVHIDSDSSLSPRDNLDERFTRICLWSDRYSKEIADSLVESLPPDVRIDSISSADNLSEIANYLRGDGSAAVIAISETGAELCVLLNKFAGVRTIFAESMDTVKAAREHAAANCLIISAQQTPLLKARQLINSFLGTSFKNSSSRNITNMSSGKRENLTN